MSMEIDISAWLNSPHRPQPYGPVGNRIPLVRHGLPPWWDVFSKRYERFSNRLETFLRCSSETDRLDKAEKLILKFQKFIDTLLSHIYNDDQDLHTSPSRASSTSTRSDRPRYQSRYRPQYLNQSGQALSPTWSTSASYSGSASNSNGSYPYSNPDYSYSSPPSSTTSIRDMMRYQETINGIVKCLDALYFLIETAQDLTDLPLVSIRQQRLDFLQLKIGSLWLVDLSREVGNVIYAVSRKLLSYDHWHVRRLMKERILMMGQLDELGAWVDEEGGRPYWRCREVCEDFKRIRDWKSTRVKGWVEGVWDWLVL